MSDPRNDNGYANIREFIGEFIGKRLVDVTQHDEEEYEKTGDAYVALMFEDGSILKFRMGNFRVGWFEAQMAGSETQAYEYGDETNEN